MAITVNEAGRRGGLAVLRNRGREYYARIGTKGQQIMRSRYPQMAEKWGRLGGRPKKLSLQDMGREEQK